MFKEVSAIANTEPIDRHMSLPTYFTCWLEEEKEVFVWPGCSGQTRVLSGQSVVGAGGWMAAKKHGGQQRVAAWRRWAVALEPGEGTTTQMWRSEPRRPPPALEICPFSMSVKERAVGRCFPTATSPPACTCGGILKSGLRKFDKVWQVFLTWTFGNAGSCHCIGFLNSFAKPMLLQYTIAKINWSDVLICLKIISEG